ncbi:MAG: NAD(P)/FAD-dependent oxidoreductase [Minisyncoccia bacterium]
MNKEYDLAVIGGGPSGMMAAIRSGELGARVILLEKNATLGKKLLLSGKTRSNITRAEFETRELAKHYGREGDFLLFALSHFGPQEVIKFFQKKGLLLKQERGKRFFPKNGGSVDVLKTLLGYLRRYHVEIKTQSPVRNLVVKNRVITKIILKDGEEILAKTYLVCTGGKSFPKTGSTGDGYFWLKQLGHTIEPLRPALVPLRVKESWPKIKEGFNLKNVSLTVYQNNQKKGFRLGDMEFTYFGISGPIVLDLSILIGELLKKGEVKVVLDLKPALSPEVLDKRIQSDFLKYHNKVFRHALDDLLPQKLIPLIIKLSGINSDKKVNKISKLERHKLGQLLKHLEMTISSLLGFEHAIITQGGVSLKEIDAKTMKSKVIDNLYLAGEIINLHGPSGGYNLQLCWSTGYLAGESAAQNALQDKINSSK